MTSLSLPTLVLGASNSLPVWANVVLGLVGGGAVGGIVTSWLQSRARRQEEWRTRMLGAADDFAQSFWLAYQQLSRVLDLVYKTHGELFDEIDLSEDESELLAGAEPLLRDMLLRLSRVTLLFGASSAAGTAAREALRKLQSAFNSLDPQPDYPLSDARRADVYLDEAEQANDRFSSLARKAAIRGTVGVRRLVRQPRGPA